jgi:hypothetical protein
MDLSERNSFGGANFLKYIIYPIIREQDTQHNTQQERTQPTNSKHTCPSRGLIYIIISNNRRQQSPLPTILMPDDDHIGQNM